MDFNELILAKPVVLVEFFANWCPHCKKMMPVVEQVSELLDGRVPVHQFDIDEWQDLAGSVGVESVPTFLIYRDGEAVWKHSGEVDGELLLSKVESFVN